MSAAQEGGARRIRRTGAAGPGERKGEPVPPLLGLDLRGSLVPAGMTKLLFAFTVVCTLAGNEATSWADLAPAIALEPRETEHALPIRERAFALDERLFSVSTSRTSSAEVTWRRAIAPRRSGVLIALTNYRETLVSTLLERWLPLPAGSLDSADVFAPVLSGNQQYLAFLTDARALTSGGANSPALFRLGINTHLLDLVSAEPDARGVIHPIAGRARRPSMSVNGRRLAFQVVQGARSNVYLRDMVELGARALCTPAMHCENPVLSGDGQRVAFVTRASLVPEDKDALQDVYVTPVEHFAPELISRRSGADGKLVRLSANIADEPLAISADGRSVAFTAGTSVWLSHAGVLRSMSELLAKAGGRVISSQPAMDIGRNLAFVARRENAPQLLYLYSFFSDQLQEPHERDRILAYPKAEHYAPVLNLSGDHLTFLKCDQSQKDMPLCLVVHLASWSAHPDDGPTDPRFTLFR
jgi:hypothetical protein